MKLDPARYTKAVEEYEAIWRKLDDALYGICRDHPEHDDLDGIVAKVYVVGRAYTTQIERHVRTDGTQGGSLMKVIRHLHANAAVVDELIDEVKLISEPLSPPKLSVIASVHGRFIALMAGVTREGMATPSFASKYLHFHHPVVPIYDSVAVAQFGKHERWKKSMACFPVPETADAAYARYLSRLWGLYQQAAQLQLPLSVKYLDYYALSLAPVTGEAAIPVEAVEAAS